MFKNLLSNLCGRWILPKINYGVKQHVRQTFSINNDTPSWKNLLPEAQFRCTKFRYKLQIWNFIALKMCLNDQFITGLGKVFAMDHHFEENIENLTLWNVVQIAVSKIGAGRRYDLKGWTKEVFNIRKVTHQSAKGFFLRCRVVLTPINHWR